MSNDNIKLEIYKLISNLIENQSYIVNDDSPLIGSESLLSSMKLVELCLALEDMALEIGFEFDWTSDTALSRSRSMFRSAGSLAYEFFLQMNTTK